MKYGWVVLLVLAAVISPNVARGQAAVYAEFSASELSGGPKGDYLYGGQAGVLIDGPKIFNRVSFQTDIQGRFVNKSGEMLDSALIGPRFSVAPKFLFKFVPFAEFNVGFGRYNDGANNSTTDYLLGVQGGVSRPLTPRFDAMLDYSWAQFGYNSGFYQPQSYSAGVIYHFDKR